MSFFGSLGTAVQGIIAQATAIGHISDNVANSTAIGYKEVNTLFADMVSSKVIGDSPVMDSNRSMGVRAIADFANRVQGTIIRDNSSTSIAISGSGFIPVSKPTGIDRNTGEPTGFESSTYYTRLGDFKLDISNRLVNSAGYYLQAAAPGGNTPRDFVVDNSPIPADPTSLVNYKANLPASAQIGRTYSTGIGIVDANSIEQSFQVVWEKTGDDSWNMTINTPGGTPKSFGPVAVTFANGVLASMSSTDPSLEVSGNGAATVAFSADFGAGAQAITLDLGTFGGGFDFNESSGLTQFSSQVSEITNLNLFQNGLVGGDFSSVSFDEDGNIIYNYTNGRSRIGGQLLLANFPEPDRLDRVDGTAFVETRNSGRVTFGLPGDVNNKAGVGDLVAGALEQSNVDVSEQMTRLIVAQQAYSMNGQVLTATDEMMSRAIDMKR
jgi:fagellar hook-basal body proteins